jgi:hypothetical protein
MGIHNKCLKEFNVFNPQITTCLKYVNIFFAGCLVLHKKPTAFRPNKHFKKLPKQENLLPYCNSTAK